MSEFVTYAIVWFHGGDHSKWSNLILCIVSVISFGLGCLFLSKWMKYLSASSGRFSMKYPVWSNQTARPNFHLMLQGQGLPKPCHDHLQCSDQCARLGFRPFGLGSLNCCDHAQSIGSHREVVNVPETCLPYGPSIKHSGFCPARHVARRLSGTCHSGQGGHHHTVANRVKMYITI